MNLPVILTPFERNRDVVGPLPMTPRKNRYVLTIMDFSSRYPEAGPLSRFGLLRKLLSDRGTNFTAMLIKEVIKCLGIDHIQASPYHPETNGMLERWHGTLKAMLRKSG